jgi:hypothetical protein
MNATLGGPLRLVVYADCLQANFAVTTSIVPVGPAGGTQTASCPSGMVVTGGGYKDNGHFSWLLPSGSGWQGSLAGNGNPTTLYAICASSPLQAGATPAIPASVASSGIGTATVSCPAGQLLVGGGFRVTPPAVDFVSEPAQAPGSNTFFTAWLATASDRSFGSQAGLQVISEGVCDTY